MTDCRSSTYFYHAANWAGIGALRARIEDESQGTSISQFSKFVGVQAYMLKQATDQGWIQATQDGQNAPVAELAGRILVLDDDPHFLRVLARILSGENFLVTSAAGACDAMELLKSAQFDLVISDLRMPECDGLSFLESLRRSGNTVPVIILTAYGEVDTYLEAMNAGATEYLNKPIQSDELLKSVHACLRSGKNRRNRA